MQVYSRYKEFGNTCKCFYCRRSRRANKALCRLLKKQARVQGRKEIEEQASDLA